MAETEDAAASKTASEKSESSILSRPTLMHLKCLWLHAGPPNRNRGVQLSLGARFIFFWYFPLIKIWKIEREGIFTVLPIW